MMRFVPAFVLQNGSFLADMTSIDAFLFQNVSVKDFRQSWSDGMAFCALLHSFLPDKIPYDDLSPSNPRENFKIAFDVAK